MSDLRDLLDDPERAMELDPGEAVTLLVRVEGLAAVLRIAASSSRNEDRPAESTDRDLTVGEAAARLRKSVRWVRDHRRTLPGYHKRGRDTLFREAEFERGRKKG